MLPDLPNPVNWLSAIASVTGISLASICGVIAANWLHKWLGALQSAPIRLRPSQPSVTAAHPSLPGEMRRALVHWLVQNEWSNAEHALRLLTGALLITLSTVLYLNPPTQDAVSMVQVLHRVSFYALLFSYAVTAFCAFRWRWKWHHELSRRGRQRSDHIGSQPSSLTELFSEEAKTRGNCKEGADT